MARKAALLLLVIAILGASYSGWAWLRRERMTFIAPDQLHYPCLRVIDGSSWERVESAAALKRIGSNRFMNRRDDPFVIDADFRVFEMWNPRMQSHPLGLLVTGPRQVDIDFELIVRSDKTVQDAKAMLLELLSHQPTLADGVSESISATASLNEFIDLLEGQDRAVGVTN